MGYCTLFTNVFYELINALRDDITEYAGGEDKVESHVLCFLEKSKSDWKTIKEEDNPSPDMIVDFFSLEEYFQNSDYLKYKGIDKELFIEKWERITQLRCSLSHDNTYYISTWGEDNQSVNLKKCSFDDEKNNLDKESLTDDVAIKYVEDLLDINSQLNLLSKMVLGLSMTNKTKGQINHRKKDNKKVINVLYTYNQSRHKMDMELRTMLGIFTERFSRFYIKKGYYTDFKGIFQYLIETNVKVRKEIDKQNNHKNNRGNYQEDTINKHDIELSEKWEEIQYLFRENNKSYINCYSCDKFKDSKTFLVDLRNAIFHYKRGAITECDYKRAVDLLNGMAEILDINLEELMQSFRYNFKRWNQKV